jgi:trehalose 6-phosphate phosphatase
MLAATLERQPVLLFLDYDGTISEITTNFIEAWPLPGAREQITALSRYPERVAVAIVSGREIDEVQRLLRLDRGILFSGNHGLEIAEADGQRWLVSDVGQCLPELAIVRQWLRDHVQTQNGFVIEDKGISVALHYRRANPEEAAALCIALEGLVRERCPHLKPCRGKKVLEVLPYNASKGYAVSFLASNAADDFVPIYFGDDLTDEDAFYGLRDNGLTVLVSSQPRPSWAKFWVQNPARVLFELESMTAVLGGGLSMQGL